MFNETCIIQLDLKLSQELNSYEYDLLDLASCLDYSSTLKMEAICSSEMSDSSELQSTITQKTIFFLCY
jgi:hypothetical protein